MTKILTVNNRFKIILFSLIFLAGCSGTPPILGLNKGMLLKCPDSPNCVNSQIKDDKHFIEPILFSGNSEEAKAQLLSALSTFKNAKLMASEAGSGNDTKNKYIRAEFTSSIFRFVDDVEFYFPENEDANQNKTTIHVRSASRMGKTDFGANRKRVEQFRSLLKRPQHNSGREKKEE